VATLGVTWVALLLARGVLPPADASAKIDAQSVHPKWPCKPDMGAKSSVQLFNTSISPLEKLWQLQPYRLLY